MGFCVTMQPNSPLFRSGVQPRKLWDEARVIEGEARNFQVFRWEDRLVCHENSTESWWATLDSLASGDDARAFWQSGFESQRVARLTAFHRGFQLANGSALLSIDAQWFDVLIEQDNSGWARRQGETQWREFAAIAPSNLSKPGAWRPSIWSRRFKFRRGRRSMQRLAPQLAREALASAPPLAHELWRRGAGARTIRLVVAATAQGWAEPSQPSQPLPKFWDAAIFKASQPMPPTQRHLLHSLGRDPFSLPAALLDSAESAASVRVRINNWGSSFFRYPSSLSWRAPDCSLCVSFSLSVDSAHEQLEAKLELRDWLSQFFAAEEVNRWLQ